MDHSGTLDPTLLRLCHPLSLRPRCETWTCTLRGRVLVVRRHAPRRPGDPWPPPPEVEGIAPPHPRVERLVAWGIDSEGATWHLFRQVPGRSLRDALSEGPFLPSRWIPVLADLAEGLAWIHEDSPAAPRLHGDVSPGNLILTPRGRAVLVGLRGDRPGVATPEDGIRVGTLPYLAAEVLEGDAPTPAAEVASMGWITCRALGALELPSGAAPPREVARTRRPDLGAIRSLDPDLAPLVEAMLAPHPEARPSAREVRRQVRRMLRNRVPGGV